MTDIKNKLNDLINATVTGDQDAMKAVFSEVSAYKTKEILQKTEEEFVSQRTQSSE